METSAGIATINPITVVPSAIERPDKISEFADEILEFKLENVIKIPQTVPNSPKKGANVTIVDRINKFLSKNFERFDIVDPN